MRWEPGAQILWSYRRDAVPVTVVQDDDDGLVAWVAPGTPRLASVPIDGRGLRDRPVAERFTVERTYEVTTWDGAGILRLERPGRAHSLWRFDDPDTGVAGWYANLEDPLTRTDTGVRTKDHILDVWMDDAGFWLWKDEDELEAVVALGRFTAEVAAAIRAEGEQVIAAFEQGAPPFDGSWRGWRPDGSWPLPTLPDDLAALHGLPAPGFA